MFLKWVLDFSKEPGAIDAGTHFIVIFRKNSEYIIDKIPTKNIICDFG